MNEGKGKGVEWKGNEDEDEEEVVGEVMCCKGEEGEGRRDAAQWLEDNGRPSGR